MAGGGTVYSGAETALRAFAEGAGIPVADTHAGKGAVPWDPPCAVGGIGSTGAFAANEPARDADIVLGTRYSDFTTASHTVSATPTSPSSTSTSPAWTSSSTRRSRWPRTPGSASRPWSEP
nr:hypothetical protein [Streptomyces sp. NY05-11A]